MLTTLKSGGDVNFPNQHLNMYISKKKLYIKIKNMQLTTVKQVTLLKLFFLVYF